MNTETKVWLTLILCLAIGSGVYLATRPSDPAPQPAQNNQEEKNKQKEDEGSSKNGNPKEDEPDPGDADVVTVNRDSAAAPMLGAAPSFQLTDQTGDGFDSASLAGRVWIANFIFTRCQATCPRQTEAFAKLQELLAESASTSSVRLLSVSVDPEHDTPEVLKSYAAQAGAGPNWHFLTGARTAIWELSKNGFKLPVADDAKNESMPIMHDSKFVLVDRNNQIRGYFDLLAENGQEAMLQAIDRVLPEMQLTSDMDQEATHLAAPPEILEMDWLATRTADQQAALADSKLLHDFEFGFDRKATGIDYNPQIVDEQRWRLRVNHYDHGTGVSVADVDGDDKLDIYFVSQAGDNKLYRNLGEGKFTDITEAAGVALGERIGVAAAFADIDNDGDADLFVTTVRGGNALLLNDGKGVFKDVTAAAGVAYEGHSSGAVFFDFDRDGWLDLFVTNVGKYTTDVAENVRLDGVTKLPPGEYPYYLGTGTSFAGHLKPELSEPSVLYRNRGDGTFENVTSKMGLVDKGWSGAATPLDANGDGWLDLYVLNMQGNDAYWENQQGAKFVRKSDVFPKTPWGAMGVKSFDFNQDGRFDLFITDMHSDMSEDIGPAKEKLKSNMQWARDFLATEAGSDLFGNAFYLAQEDGSYKEVSDSTGAENYWPWGLSAGDLNADGFEDVFIASSMCFPYRYSANSVLLNDQGKRWVDSEFALGVEPRPAGARIQPWFELDADNRDKDHQYSQNRTGKVVVWSALGSRSSVLFDLDGDGDLDVVTNDFNSPPLVLRSNLLQKHSDRTWLAVQLEGSASNRDGLGAVVTVVAGGRLWRQTMDGQSGYLAQSRMPLYFGLNAATEVERIEVRWLAGAVQILEGPIAANQTLKVVQEKDSAPSKKGSDDKGESTDE